MINTLIVILVPFAFGLFFLSIFMRKEAENFSLTEKLALAFPLGLGFLAMLMFLYGLLGVPLTFSSLILTVLALMVISGLYLLRTGDFCLKKEEFRLPALALAPTEMVLAGLIALKIIYVFFVAIIKPLVDVDAFQQYSIVAKGIFYGKTFTLPYLHQFIQDKPLFPYLTQGWAFIGLQAVNDSLFKILSPTLFLCFLLIFYCGLRKYYSRVYGLLFTFFLSTLPFFVYHASTAYADFPQTVYLSIGTIYLFLFMKGFKSGLTGRTAVDLLISLSFLGLAAWIKRAGLILSLIDLIVLAAFLAANWNSINRDLLKRIAAAFIIFLLIIAPWVIYGHVTTIRENLGQLMSKNGAVTSNLAERSFDKTDIVFNTFLRKLFLYADWHLAWFLFIVALIFFYKRSLASPLIFLLAIIILDISILFIQFRFSGAFTWLLDGTLLDRLIMNYVPVLLFYSAESISESWPNFTNLFSR